METIIGPIRKMYTYIDGEVQYELPLGNRKIPMNQFLGKPIKMTWQKEILCSACGNATNKSYAGGFCYTCFLTAPEASECIIRPEQCVAHLGKGIRDAVWDQKHHFQPHFVYLALTDAVKVGVTRHDQIPTRWIDQGAWKAIRLAEVPYRQLAGDIEVALKDYVTDKTNWRKMLKDIRDEAADLEEVKYEMLNYLDASLQDFVSDNDEIVEIKYPVIRYPGKVKSVGFDKVTEVAGTLAGIRGQYLIFSDGRVINMRKHTGYVAAFEEGRSSQGSLFD